MNKKITSDEILRQRHVERGAEFRIAIKISAERLIGPLFPLFWFADILYAPDYKWTFLPLRISVFIFSFFISNVVRKVHSPDKLQALCLLLLSYPALVLTYMCVKTTGISSGYYAGLNLLAAGAIYFFPWTKFFAISAISLIYFPYLLSPFYTSWTKNDLNIFFVNLFFIVGTITISSVVRYIYEVLKKQEVKIKLDLKNEINQRNLIIEQKTRESIQLSTLAKQFSPQVVQALTSGSLELGQTLKRSKICAIFIDIVNSTDRIIRIDQDDLDVVLKMFMEDTMKVLLKYDITIDKFLGDGVLAFSNAPLQKEDYVERTVSAAMEIRNRITHNREKYMSHWLSELQIRVGIATGYANVGFYGSEDYFRSYTAIGKVVNLASRLCGVADPSQILVSQEIAQLPQITENYKIENIGYKKLKGFEQDIINIFSIVGSKNETEETQDIPTCPLGHGILHFDTDEKGIYHLKCRSCSFTLDTLPLINKKIPA